MPVLDAAALDPAARSILVDAFDALCRSDLKPFARLGADATRAAIDAAFERALDLPTLRPVREMVGREPVVCLRPLGRRQEAMTPLTAAVGEAL